MKRASVLAITAVACAMTARASPSPPLPWTTSRFSVPTEMGAIEFAMECPRGSLTRFFATLGERMAALPLEQLATLSLSSTCSGVITRASRDNEGTGMLVAIELTVELSHEYVVEQLRITFDARKFKFTQAIHLVTYPEEQTQVNRIELQ